MLQTPLEEDMLYIPDVVLGTRVQRTEVRQILRKLLKSDEDWQTHLHNAEIQKYTPYWVAVLMLGAKQAENQFEFLADFVLNQFDENTELTWPGCVAESVLLASR